MGSGWVGKTNRKQDKKQWGVGENWKTAECKLMATRYFVYWYLEAYLMQDLSYLDLNQTKLIEE